MYTKISIVFFSCLLLWACEKEKPAVFAPADDTITGFNDFIAGDAWQPVNVSVVPDSRIQAMGIYDGNMVLSYLSSNLFSFTFDGSFATFIQQPTGSLGGGTGIEKMVQIDGNLYGLGQFGGIGMFAYDPTANDTWSPFGYSNSRMTAATLFEGEIIGSCEQNPVLRTYDNGNWTGISNSISGQVNDMIVYRGELIVAGDFIANALDFMTIAKYDPTNDSWTSLGSGLNGQVLDLEIMNDQLYAVGEFTENGSGNTGCRLVAKWDGTEWSDLNGGLLGGNQARVLHKFDNQLFIGGTFESGGSSVSHNIIKWTDDLGFTTVGPNGISEPIGEIMVYKTQLYVANAFDGVNSNLFFRLE